MLTLTTAKESRLIYSIVMDPVDSSLPICFSLLRDNTIVQLDRGLLFQNCLQPVTSTGMMSFLYKDEVMLFKEAPSGGNSQMC